MAEVEKLARAHNPKLWDSLTTAERKEMVAKLNTELQAESEAEAFIRRSLGMPKR